jgi:bifunctional DNA-binding transcriptional regulator/antitoxin component of YhaV-PrlF toxin-antitoxin module
MDLSETVLNVATSNPNSRSLRSTVPLFIVKKFQLKPGDKLQWDLRAEGDQIVIIVKPKKVRKNE